MSDELAFMSVAEASECIRLRRVSPVELARAALDRIEAVDGRLNSFITVCPESALESARTAEKEIRGGRYRGPLHGVPFAVKDLLDTAGVRTTAGSKILSGNVPTRDATAVARLRQAGAILLGKTNTHEFAFGATTVNPHFGPTRNPWNPEHIAGGSSGGSAGAVAAGMCGVALGTDTGGSIRVPASCCGVIGLKPTYGRVSRSGVIPLSWSLDHVGPIARTVADAAIALEAMAGYDPQDSSSVDAPVPKYFSALVNGANIRGVRIGVPRNYFFERINPEVERPVRNAIGELERLGATVIDVALPHVEDAVSILRAVQMPEAAAYHLPWLRTRAADYGKDVLRRLQAGLLIPAAHYLQAQRARSELQRDFHAALAQVDVIATPTLPIAATPIGQAQVRIGGIAEDVPNALVRFTCPMNLTGVPAITLPCGFTADGLPVGMQLVGRPFDEVSLLRVAQAFERGTRWRHRPPAPASVASG